MSADTYYKAVRLDGTSFHDPSFRWVPEDWTPADGRVRVEHPDYDPTWGAGGYLSASTEPADCTGAEWPCRLLIVEPVGEPVLTPAPNTLPHKRAGGAFLVVDERPAHEALGPCGREVTSLLAELEAFPPAAWGAAREAARDAAWYAARYAARDAARDAAWIAARDAAWIAARDAARDAVRDAARDAAWDAAWDAVRAAALATLVRDVIAPEQYERLMAPVEAARAVMREADSTTTPRSDQ